VIASPPHVPPRRYVLQRCSVIVTVAETGPIPKHASTVVTSYSGSRAKIRWELANAVEPAAWVGLVADLYLSMVELCVPEEFIAITRNGRQLGRVDLLEEAINALVDRRPGWDEEPDCADAYRRPDELCSDVGQHGGGGAMPAKVSENIRPIVMAGFAKLVELVKK